MHESARDHRVKPEEILLHSIPYVADPLVDPRYDHFGKDSNEANWIFSVLTILMPCVRWCMEMIACVLLALMTVPPGHPCRSLLVFDVANMEISVRIRLNLYVYFRNELLRIVFGD